MPAAKQALLKYVNDHPTTVQKQVYSLLGLTAVTYV